MAFNTGAASSTIPYDTAATVSAENTLLPSILNLYTVHDGNSTIPVYFPNLAAASSFISSFPSYELLSTAAATTVAVGDTLSYSSIVTSVLSIDTSIGKATIGTLLVLHQATSLADTM